MVHRLSVPVISNRYPILRAQSRLFPRLFVTFSFSHQFRRLAFSSGFSVVFSLFGSCNIVDVGVHTRLYTIL